MKPGELPEELRVKDAWTPAREAAVWNRVLKAQQQQEGARAAGVVLGFFCLAAFTALGIFGLVRSRTAVIALSGDEAADDTTLALGPGRVAGGAARGDEAAPAGGEPSAAPSGTPRGDVSGSSASDPAAGDAAPGEPPPIAVSGRKLRFRDGSIAILQSAETVLEPVSVENRRIVNVLRAGAARFEITKRPGRLFRVIAGDAIVEVLGTKFELARVGSRLRVGVLEGRVRVSWTGGERRLTRGESGVFPPEVASRRRPKPEEVAAAEPGRADETPPPAPAALAPSTGPPSPAAPSRADDELGALLRKADLARASGRALDAAKALRAALDKAPSDARAPLAQFRLGRLLLEDMGKPGEAAVAFARARALAPEGPLAPDALAREIESRAAAGERTTARTLARAYLTQYPNGSHAAWVRRWGAPE